MSKIICDVCGTSYPETATHCPICGCVRPGDAKVVAGDTNEPEAQASGSYNYVKGGRFSKTNVKKRNRTGGTAETPIKNAPTKKENGKKSEVGVVIAILALLLMIVAVVIFIAMRFFAPALPETEYKPSGTTQGEVTNDPSGTTAEPTVLEIPCTQIIVSKAEVTFDKAGAALLLNVTTEPRDTTDIIKFTSSDDTVATVSADGKITAVGGGEAVIAITCGQAAAECKIICNIEETKGTEATTVPTYSTDGFKLNREDFTLTKKGDSHVLYNGEIPVASITWTTDDPNVASVENGKVVAVGKGVTKVHAEYGGVKLSCIVRCADSVGAAQTNANTESTDQTQSTPYNISSTDVTITVGEEFQLKLLDSNRTAVSVVWTVANSEICSVTNNTVKGQKAGQTTVSVVYEGVTYSCTVRVRT